MAHLPTTLNELEGHFCSLKNFLATKPSEISYVLSTICLHESRTWQL